MGKQIPNPVYEIRKSFPVEATQFIFDTSRQRRCSIPNREEQLCKYTRANTGHYILVRAHNSVHAEPFRRCLSIIPSSMCTKCSTLLDIISSFLLTLPGLMVSSIAPQEAFLDGYSRTYCSKLAISKLMLLMELAIITSYFPTQTPKSLQRRNDISYPDIPAYSHKQTSKLRSNLVRQFPCKWELFHLQQLEKPVNVAGKVFLMKEKYQK